jgi:ankyrin repeat protein
MASALPVRPSLAWLRKTAKERLERLRIDHPRAKLADAQLALAGDYGFPTWRALRFHVETAERQPNRPTKDEIVRTLLHRARTGGVDDVRAMLDAVPVLVNATGPHPFWGGRPQPLHMAIEGRQRAVFDLLLERGADVNGANAHYSHWSPLMLALHEDEAAMRDELLKRGAGVGLAEALLMADDERVEALLQSGRLPDLTPNDGSLLAFARTPAAIDRLLALGASTETKDRWGSTPVDAVSRLGKRGDPLVRHLIARGVAAGPKEYARLGDIDTLRRMVEADPAVARLDSVLMAAVEFEHHDIVEWLLGQGASVNARTEAESRATALHTAAWNGDLPMIKLLLTAGADVNALDAQYENTPRGWAATAIEVTGNRRCGEVVAFLDQQASTSSSSQH